MTEPLACTVYGVLDTAGVRVGENVVLAGPGPVGLLAMQLAKVAGTTAVMIGTNLDLERLKLAKELGADGVINVEETENIVEAVGDVFGLPQRDPRRGARSLGFAPKENAFRSWGRVIRIFIFESLEPYLLGSKGYATSYDSGRSL